MCLNAVKSGSSTRNSIKVFFLKLWVNAHSGEVVYVFTSRRHAGGFWVQNHIRTETRQHYAKILPPSADADRRPYLFQHARNGGVGVGASSLDIGSLTTSGGPSEGGKHVVNASYALMAGITTMLSEKNSIDVGYRFINLGEFEQDSRFSSGLNAAATNFDDLHAHEFKAGLRAEF
tara:strand:- start:184033 stop:184560 length:528 start_codon:yes stop_codon:yes gene_type:complete